MLRRGHIPTVLLFIGAVALVIITLFSLASFKNVSTTTLATTFFLQNELAFRELYVQQAFERAVNETFATGGLESFCPRFQSIIAQRDPRSQEFGTFFSTIRNSPCSLTHTPGSQLVLPAFTIMVVSGPQEITQLFYFEAHFSEAGTVQYIYK